MINQNLMSLPFARLPLAILYYFDYETLELIYQIDPTFVQRWHRVPEFKQMMALKEGQHFASLIEWLQKSFNQTYTVAELHALEILHTRFNIHYNNQLMSLPESIGSLTNLKEILISNQLTSLPESIGNLTNLKYLNLDFNRLTSLPESIGNLTNLKYLNLNFNRLTSLPKSIGDLISLERLRLYGNQLTSLPESIGNLTNLRELYLSRNQLTRLPESIGRLTRLICLLLDNIGSIHLPESIGNLTELRYINNREANIAKYLNRYK